LSSGGLHLPPKGGTTNLVRGFSGGLHLPPKGGTTNLVRGFSGGLHLPPKGGTTTTTYKFVPPFVIIREGVTNL